jgi:hypothetical protein
MPGISGVTVVTTLAWLFFSARRAAGALGARHSLRPHCSRRRIFVQLGRNHAAGMRRCARHCEERSDEAIQTFFAPHYGLLRFARNDDLLFEN